MKRFVEGVQGRPGDDENTLQAIGKGGDPEIKREVLWTGDKPIGS